MKRCLEVLPGSLDYLYYNGTLPTIPYEAYDMPVYGQMNGSQYLNYAQRGNMYNAYIQPDTFIPSCRPNVEQGQDFSLRNQILGIRGYGRDNDWEKVALGKDGKNIRIKAEKAISKGWDIYQSTPDWFKGIIGGCAIVATSCLLIRRGIKSNFFSKLNPVNWFKK